MISWKTSSQAEKNNGGVQMGRRVEAYTHWELEGDYTVAVLQAL
jgi:hypothetical protein